MALLLLQFFLRTHHLTLQDPYIDEAFHTARAAMVYDFDQHPGHFAHGKLLAYFWIGLFGVDRGPGSLFAARAAIAIFSLITGAAVYLLGRLLFRGRWAGALALAIYAVMPLAFFYERMAMADPLATGFAALVLWRSWVLMRRPSLREGVVIGALLGMATLAKLTMGALPLVPVVATLIGAPWRAAGGRGRVGAWLDRGLPPLVLAALVMALLWVPILVPAARVRGTDDAFVLVDSYNIRDEYDDVTTPDGYLESVIPLVADFTGAPLLIAAGVGLALQIALGAWRDHAHLRSALLVLALTVALLAPPTAFASLVTARYMMPLALPITLALTGAVAALWRWIKPLPLRGGALALAGGALLLWSIAAAGPFIATDLRDPYDLPFHGANEFENLRGVLLAQGPERRGADLLNALDPPPQHVYGSWNGCYMLFFYTELPVGCYELHLPRNGFGSALAQDLAPGETAYLMLNTWNLPTTVDFSGYCTERVAAYERAGINRPMTVWTLRRAPC